VPIVQTPSNRLNAGPRPAGAAAARRAALFAAIVLAAASLPGAAALAAPTCNGLPATLIVPPGGGVFEGTDGPDVILGTAGPDFIKAQGGDDVVCGGGGDDVILGGPGNDTLLGEDGNDKLRGAAGDDTLRGGAGSDRVLPETGNDLVDGGGGSDIVDYLAAAGPVAVDLGAGTAVYSPKGGGTHTATLVAVEKVDGSRYDDTLVGDSKRNVLRGKQGVDRIIGGSGDDDLIGGTDRDTIRGGGGADLVKGQAGDDDLDGSTGDDRIVGGAGSDTLVGGDGNDTLIGGLRRHEGEYTNTMDGGDGFDTCRWDFDPIADCETRRPAADLDLSMAAIPTEAAPGGTVVLRLTVANRGPDPSSGFTVAAPLPDGLTYQSHSGRGSYTASSGTWAVGALAAGAATTLEIAALVGPALPITAVAEIATASPYDPDSTPGNGAAAEDDRAAVTITRLPASADLSLTMTANEFTPDYGTPVALTLTVGNAGPDPATGVAVTGLLPAGLVFASASGDGTYSPATGVWTVGTVQPGSTASIQVVASVGSTAPLTAAAEITASGVADPDSTPGNGVDGEDDEASVTIDAPPAADLRLTKSVDDDTPVLGGEVTFTVTVVNAGPDPATGVVVTGGLPAGLSYLRHVGAGSYDHVTGVWTVGSLGIGASRSVHVTAQVDTTVESTDPIVASAEITSASPDDPDSTPGNGIPEEDDYATVAVDPDPAADLELTKEVDVPDPPFGGEVTFTLTVTNRGPDPATGVAVTDLLPAGFFHVSDDGAGSYDLASGVWTVGALEVGSRSLQVIALVETTVPTVNVAEVTASDQWDPDSTPGNGDPAEDDRASATVDGGPADDSPPSLTGLSIAPDPVDIASSDRQVTVTIQVTDDISGVAELASMEARFLSPSAADSVTFAFGRPVSGTDLDAGFTASDVVPFGSEPGTWTLDYLSLEDDDLNGVVLTAPDVAGLGLPATFEVTGPAVDLTPPTLAGFTISPASIDITPGDQQVTLAMRVTDDLSGVAGGATMSARFLSPSLVHAVTFSFPAPVSGSDLDATFEATNWVVVGSEPGTWTLEYLSLEDDDGNATTLDASDLAGLGFPSTFQVAGPPVDFTAPSLVDFTIVPPSVDVTSKAQEVTVTLRVTDDLAGVADLARMDARFRSPSNLDAAEFDFVSPKPASSDLDAEFEATDTILTGSEPGTWTLDYLYLVDDDGNGTYLDAADLYELGLPYSFEVVGSGDVTPPTLADFDITPGTVDVTSGAEDVTVTMRITDDISGVAGSAYMFAEFWSPSGFEWVEFDFGSPKPGSKDLDAVFEASATFDQYSEPGTWTLAFLSIEDDDLNGVQFDADDLTALGFPSSFEVIGSPAGSPF
jgi:uncharacterized repeat protein (TIGR01451 family)